MDVIAKCAFGLTIDNLDKEDDEFMKRAKRVFNPSANKSPIILLGCELFWHSDRQRRRLSFMFVVFGCLIRQSLILEH